MTERQNRKWITSMPKNQRPAGSRADTVHCGLPASVMRYSKSVLSLTASCKSRGNKDSPVTHTAADSEKDGRRRP